MLNQITGLLLATLLCASVSAQEPAGMFAPSTLKGPAKGKPNDVMVLATAHLAELPKSFQPAGLDMLNARLRAWRPAIIAIESLSGAQCAYLRQFLTRYDGTMQRFCWDPAPARAATGLDVPAAAAEIDRLLQSWPAAPAPAQRRRLAAMFLAGGEPASAVVQWLRLPQEERHAGDGLDATLVALLNAPGAVRGQRGEDMLIAAPLAAALGLERVVAMDDHTGLGPDHDPQAYAAAMAKAGNNPANAQRINLYKELVGNVGNTAGVLALYRGLNDPSFAMSTYHGDFGAALEESSPQQFGRDYVTYWETRNLRMASNIREAIGAKPGSRTLVIVGASHKGYLEAYLNQMHDVHIVSTDVVLR